jgi:signal transduction histidine kinase
MSSARAAFPFDHELSLAALMAGMPLDKLGAALHGVVGTPLCLSDAAGNRVFGVAQPATARCVPVRLDTEAIGMLCSAGADGERLASAARLVEIVLALRAMYFRAAKLHAEAMRCNQEELSRCRQDLGDAQAHYRELELKIEQQVAEQVAMIEDKQRQIYQAEKLASIGQLAAGVAHEINNPIGFIRSNLVTSASYLAKLRAFGDSLAAGSAPSLAETWRGMELDFVLGDFADLVRESVDGADRIARIVRDLKGFSNIDGPEEEVVDLNDNLRTVCSMIAGQLPAGVRLVQELAPLPRILCLPGHLNQVFLNILRNAGQAIEAGGQIRVESDHMDGQIRVRIADTGRGMTPEVLPHVFEPFFTTQEIGKGTGLGLTVARDIVQAHGGRIDVVSTPGAGSVFTVMLPV